MRRVAETFVIGALAVCCPHLSAAQVAWPRADSLRLSVSAAVHSVVADTVEITYSATIDAGSVQSLETFAIVAPWGSKTLGTPQRWFPNQGMLQDSTAVWWMAGGPRIVAAPGTSLSGMSVRGTGIVLPATFYAIGYARIPDAPGENEPSAAPPIWENSVKGRTIALVPVEFLPVDQRDWRVRAPALLDQACAFGWISPSGICTSLRGKLGRWTETGRANEGMAFWAELNAQRGNHVTEEGYAILSTNVPAPAR